MPPDPPGHHNLQTDGGLRRQAARRALPTGRRGEWALVPPLKEDRIATQAPRLAAAPGLAVALVLAAVVLPGCSEILARPARNPGAQASPPPFSSDLPVAQRQTPTALSQTPAADPGPLQLPDYAALRADVQALIKDQYGTYGVYVEDLPTGLRFSINPDREFVAASTIKVPLVLYLYREASAGRVDLESSLAIEPGDYEEGSGRLRYAPFGSRYTLRELGRLALVDSDNVATQMLMRSLGRENFRAWLHGIGAFISPDKENITSPRDMAAFFKALLEFKKDSPALAGEIFDALEHTRFSDRLPALLPKDVTIAHKIGSQVRVVNDAGIVFLPRHPYIISVFTDDVNEGEAAAAIAQISRLVYDCQASLR